MTLDKLSLNYYSFGYSGGLTGDRLNPQSTLSLSDFIKFSLDLGFGGVEFPIDRFYSVDKIDQGIDFIKQLKSNNVRVFLDLESANFGYLIALIPRLIEVNIDVIRIKMNQIGKTFYGGNRYLSTSFNLAKSEFIHLLKKVDPVLEEYGVTLAIENHQDLHSSELLEISRKIKSGLIGITWDVGNSFAVFDTIETFYNRVGPLIKNVHLKDYVMCQSPSGFRLVRCSLGKGAVDFQKVFKLLGDSDLHLSVELGAQTSRESHINIQRFWEEFKHVDRSKNRFQRSIKSMIKVESEQSYYEKGLRGSRLKERELVEVKESASYLERLFAEKENGK